MTADPYAPRKAPGQQRSRRTVERILDAAARIFDDLGYADTTTNDIADEAGVSVGSLYQYFPNKDALLVALAHRHVDDTTVVLDQLLGGTTDDDFRAVVRDVVDVVVAQHELDRLHLLLAHQAPRTPALQQELDRFRRRMTDAADRLLTPSIADHRRRTLTADLVVAVIDAAVHDVILSRPAGPARDEAVAFAVAAVEAIVDRAADPAPA